MPDLLERLKTALAERYAVESVIGRGGMATVFVAEDLKHHRKVAVKVMHPELATAVGTERFLREVEIVAGLAHPHILPLFDSGEADGLLYYVMPYLEDENLRDRLEREKQLPIEDALRITREVADALDYAHKQGVVHRDIKPGNILFEKGHALIADFGVARALQAAGGEKLTATGLAVGTPAYMSPEQGGGAGDLDGRTDIYALGCVLYEMLAGNPPFTGSTPQVVIKRHSLDPVPNLRTARETAPDSVQYAVTKALAKVPADRFSTAEEFVKALSAPPPRVATRQKGRRVAGVLVGVAAVLAVGYVLGRGVFGVGSAEPVTVVLAEPTVGEEDSVLGQVVRTGLEMALLASPQISAVIPREVGQALEAMGREPRATLDEATALEVAARTGAAGVVAADLRRLGTGSLVITASVVAPDGATRAIVRRQATDDDALLSVLDTLSIGLRRELGEREETLEESPSLLHLLTPSMEAARLYAEGQSAWFTEGFGSIAYVERAVAADPGFAMGWRWLGELRQNMLGDFLTPYERERELYDRLLPHQRRFDEAKHASFLDRDYRKAVQLHRAAIEAPADDTRGDPDYPDSDYTHLALAYMELGDPWRAEETLTELYGLIAEGLATDWDPAHLNMGLATAQQGDWPEAERYMSRWREVWGHDLAWMGEFFIAAAGGRWERAGDAARTATTTDRDPWTRLQASVLLGTVEAVRGRPLASRAAFATATAAATELDPFFGLSAQMQQADAEFFALGDTRRASAYLLDTLTKPRPEAGQPRRYYARAQAVAAAICAEFDVSTFEDPMTRLGCGAEVVVDSLRDTIESLEVLGWRAAGGGQYADAVRIGSDPRLSRAGGVGLRARAPAAIAYEALGLPDSAAFVYKDMARARFGWISNATSAFVMRSWALRRLAALGGPAGDSAVSVLTQDWADAEPEFLARVAYPLGASQ